MRKDNSTSYALLKIVVRFALRIYYRHVTIIGPKNFPESGAVILVSNHQNALMDPLILCSFLPGQLHWLARADVFNSRISRFVLSGLHMMPVYRPRDQVDIHAKSKITISNCIDKLVDGHVVALFPEGTHHQSAQLRSLKKGFARIAIEAQRKIPVCILPVAVNYGDYRRFRSNVVVNIGKPISVGHLISGMDSTQNAISRMVEITTHELSELMIDTRDKTLPKKVLALRFALATEHFESRKFDWQKEFAYTKSIMNKCAEFPLHDQQLDKLVEEAIELRKQLGITTVTETQELEVRNDGHLRLIKICLLPLAVIGCVIHWIPGRLSSWAATKFINDQTFYSSIVLICALIIFPLWWLLIWLLAQYSFSDFAVSVFVVVSVLFLGWIYLLTEHYLPPRLFNRKRQSDSLKEKQLALNHRLKIIATAFGK